MSGLLDGTNSLPTPGTEIVNPDGWKGYIDSEGMARVTRIESPTAVTGYTMIGVALVGLAMLLLVSFATKPARAAKQRRMAADLRAGQSRDRWDALRTLSRAPPVTPPSPVLIDTPRSIASASPAAPPAGWGAPADETAAGPAPAADPEEAPAPGIPEPSAPADPVVTGASSDRSAVPAMSDPVSPAWSGPAVLMLGPVDTVGWESQPDRQVLVELAAYLMTHNERAVGADELRNAVWSQSRVGDREVNRNAVGQNISRLRRCLGAGHLPDATAAGGYRLASTVTSDWVRFQALVEAARRVEGPEVGDLLRQALGLVRGRPFASVAERTYGWVWDEMLAAEMEAAVSGAAHWAVGHLVEHGPVDRAEWAARRGLLAVPGDETLLGDRLLAVAARGDKAALDRAWRDTKETVGGDGMTEPLRRAYEHAKATVRHAGNGDGHGGRAAQGDQATGDGRPVDR